MQFTSVIAIYSLFWVLSAFLVMPFGIRNHFETDTEMVKGQERGAPTNFKPGKILLRTTALATAAFALFYFNYTNQWITVDDIDFFDSRSRLESN